jgi:hypothetical protein
MKEYYSVETEFPGTWSRSTEDVVDRFSATHCSSP